MSQSAIDHWLSAIKPYLDENYLDSLYSFIEKAYQIERCTPAKEDIFKALSLTPLDRVRVVILGQDPYPNPEFACGLAFSVRSGVTKLPGSLKNIFKVACPNQNLSDLSGDLTSWAKQGVLLLNTALTFSPAQDHYQMWKPFTDAIIKAVNDYAISSGGVVFLLWGSHAKERASLISSPNEFLESSHPCQMSARLGFLECNHFKIVNEMLVARDEAEINWDSVVKPQPQRLF